MALKIKKLDFELGQNTDKIPNGLWYLVADYVKLGKDSFSRAKRRFAVSTIVSRLNEVRETKNIDEVDLRLILMAEINQTYSKINKATEFEQEILAYIIDVFKILTDGGVI